MVRDLGNHSFIVNFLLGKNIDTVAIVADLPSLEIDDE